MTKTCSVCKKPLGERFLLAKGVSFHNDCYTGLVSDIEVVTAKTTIKVKAKGDLRKFDGTPPDNDDDKERILKENIVDTLDRNSSAKRDDD